MPMHVDLCWFTHHADQITNVAKRLFKHVPYDFIPNISVNFLQSSWIHLSYYLPKEDSCW